MSGDLIATAGSQYVHLKNQLKFLRTGRTGYGDIFYLVTIFRVTESSLV